MVLVSVGLDPMGPTTSSYVSQPVERSSSSGLTGWEQRLSSSPSGTERAEPNLISLFNYLAYVQGMKPAYRFIDDVGTFGIFDRIRRRVPTE